MDYSVWKRRYDALDSVADQLADQIIMVWRCVATAFYLVMCLVPLGLLVFGATLPSHEVAALHGAIEMVLEDVSGESRYIRPQEVTFLQTQRHSKEHKP